MEHPEPQQERRPEKKKETSDRAMSVEAQSVKEGMTPEQILEQERTREPSQEEQEMIGGLQKELSALELHAEPKKQWTDSGTGDHAEFEDFSRNMTNVIRTVIIEIEKVEEDLHRRLKEAGAKRMPSREDLGKLPYVKQLFEIYQAANKKNKEAREKGK